MFSRTRPTAALLATAAVLATGLAFAPAASAEPAAVTPAGSAALPGDLADILPADLPEGSLAADALDELRDLIAANGPGAEAALADLVESIRRIEAGEIDRDGRPSEEAGEDVADSARTAPLATFGSSGGDAVDESDGGRAPWLDADGEGNEPVAYRDDVTEKTDFWLPALVPNCGVAGSPVTTAKATVQPGPNYGAGPIFGNGNLAAPYIPPGHAFYHLVTHDTRLAPVTDGTDVTVMWFNLTERTGGSAKLDDSVLGLGINSQTSTLAETGEGAVIAVIYGTVRYAGNGPSCTVLPTIGSVQVG